MLGASRPRSLLGRSEPFVILAKRIGKSKKRSGIRSGSAAKVNQKLIVESILKVAQG